jgi:undecaprenyl-diphosphatase
MSEYLDYLYVAILGALQGVTEFLPISSSGHLVIANELLAQTGLETLPDFVELNIVLHGGTLLSIVAVYWRRILRLLTQDRRVIAMLVVGTLPAAAIGLPLHQLPQLRPVLESTLVAGLMLPVTGLLLLWSTRLPVGDTDYVEITWRQALVIGLFQAVAILPGISRSGTTIVAGLLVGLRRDAAATFSFLLAIVAIAAACVLEAKHLLQPGTSTPHAPLLLFGATVSFAVGVLALVWLLQWLRQGRLHYFAWWCIPVGVVITLWQLAGSGN